MESQSQPSGDRVPARHHLAPNRWTMDRYQPGHYRPGTPRNLRDHLARIRTELRGGWS